jgi:ribonuclease P protein component
MLPRASRLRAKDQIDQVFRKGRAVMGHTIILKFIQNQLSTTQVAVLVGKKISNKATARNRIRRRLQEIVRLKIDLLPSGIDLLVIARTLKLRDISFTELINEFENLSKKVLSTK